MTRERLYCENLGFESNELRVLTHRLNGFGGIETRSEVIVHIALNRRTIRRGKKGIVGTSDASNSRLDLRPIGVLERVDPDLSSNAGQLESKVHQGLYDANSRATFESIETPSFVRDQRKTHHFYDFLYFLT